MPAIEALARRLVEVAGVHAVTLGGSRARGTHTPASDVDLGVYYRPPLDLAALGALARRVAGPEATVTAPGAWGPWVDGGAWLEVDGVTVDWIYRDVDRVRASWDDAGAGRLVWHAQVGHPLGVPGFAYAAELALCRILADPSGELTALQEQARAVPAALADALAGTGLWEARFCVGIAAKAVSRADTAYVAGCLFRALSLCGYALTARAGRWPAGEKGALAATDGLPGAPQRFGQRCQEVLGRLGSTPSALADSVAAAAALVEEAAAAVSR